MNKTYKIDVDRFERYDDEYLSVEAAVNYANRIIEGTDAEAGDRLGKKLVEITSAGQKLTHPLIIFGNRFIVPAHKKDEIPSYDGFNIQARDSLFNRALLKSLGLEEEYQPSDFVGGREYTILGKTVTTEPIFDPATELTEVEENGLLRRMRVVTRDQKGELKTGPKLPCGFRIIPQFALRLTYPGMVEEV